MMDVTADHAIKFTPLAFMRQRVLECRDDIDGGLDVLLGKRGQRPVAQTEQGATASEPVIEPHRAAVDRVASQRNPLVVERDHIEDNAVSDQSMADVRGQTGKASRRGRGVKDCEIWGCDVMIK